MGQQLFMWAYKKHGKPRVHLKYKNMTPKVATQEEAPQIRPNMEPRGMLETRINMSNHMVMELKYPRN
jgi:hypothetical protein